MFWLSGRIATSWMSLKMKTETETNPFSPMGNFKRFDFLNAYQKCYKMSHVCTLIVTGFRRFGTIPMKIVKNRWNFETHKIFSNSNFFCFKNLINISRLSNYKDWQLRHTNFTFLAIMFWGDINFWRLQ